MLPLHTSPVPPQVWPEQHGCPAPPHAAHVPDTQLTDAPVHSAPVQQSCPLAPHVPQLPFEHTPPTVGQVEPLPVHTPLTQQPPFAQVLDAQHASPGPPQWVQMPRPLPVHAELASQVRPAQHICPAPPHAWHTPPTHAPLVQVVPQHGAPSVPQPAMSPTEASSAELPLLLVQPHQPTTMQARINPRTRASFEPL